MSAFPINFDLVRKYNVAAPRYTSYPPATQFKEMEARTILEGIEADRESQRDLSLYVHLPFCKELCWFCGCTTVITTQQNASARYLDYIERDLASTAPLMNPDRRVVQLHFGGGTPTFLQPDELARLGRMLKSHFKFASVVEAGVEIDPRRVTLDHVLALRDSGFNRASLGVQDFNPDVQKAVHRIQSRQETEQTVAWLRQENFMSINLDLMYGLPYQTVASFETTLATVMELRPERIALFNYAHVPWLKPAQNILKNLPTPENKLEIFKVAIEHLTSHGYVYIGMDHFALADDELTMAQRNKSLQRNFQGYSTCGETDIYAFGMSAISQSQKAYWQREKELPHYYAALDAGKSPILRGYLMTEDDKIRRDVIMRLMCDMSLDYRATSTRLGISFTDYFADAFPSLRELEADGLLVTSPDGLVVTDLGRLLIRNIAVCLDAYTTKREPAQFSKTI